MTPIDLLAAVIGAIALAAGAVVDERTCRIPNWLTFPAIAVGTALMGFRCLSGYPLLLAPLTFAVSYGYVYLLWRSGLWGGGDAKMTLAVFLLGSPGFSPLAFIPAFSACLSATVLLRGLYTLSKGVPARERRPLGHLLLTAFLPAYISLSILEAWP